MKWFRRSVVAAKAPLVVSLLAALLAAGCGGGSEKRGVKKRESLDKYLELGDKYMGQEKKRKAIEAYSKAIQLDSNSRKAYVSRAMLYNELREQNKALADYTKAIQLDPRGSSYPYEERAKIYSKQGRQDKADADRKMAEAIRKKEWDKLPKMREDFESKRKR